MYWISEILHFILTHTNVYKFISIFIYEHVRSRPKTPETAEPQTLRLPPHLNPDCSYMLQISSVVSFYHTHWFSGKRARVGRGFIKWELLNLIQGRVKGKDQGTTALPLVHALEFCRMETGNRFIGWCSLTTWERNYWGCSKEEVHFLSECDPRNPYTKA